MLFPYADDVPKHQFPRFTAILIAINTLIFFWTLTLAPLERQLLSLQRGLMPARLGQFWNPRPLMIDVRQMARIPHLGVPVEIRRVLPMAPAPAATLGSLVTSLFLHGTWAHLVGNMLFLWAFGASLENRLGSLGFLGFYLTGGVLASLCHAWIYPASTVPVIGASGAISAVLGAYLVTWPRAWLRCIVVLVVFFFVVELPAVVFLAGWFLLQLLEANQALRLGVDGGVAWWAHAGGFVAGMFLMTLLGPRPAPPASELESPSVRRPPAA